MVGPVCLRRSPCEWITAATPLKLIGLSSDVFYKLEAESESFSNWLDSTNSPAELMSVLQPSLANRPSAFPEDREVLRRLVPHMTLIPARSKRNLPVADDKLYFWNAQVDNFTLPIGQEVDHSLLAKISEGPSLRLFSVDRDCWVEAFKPPLELKTDTTLPSINDIWANDRYADLLVPTPDGQRTDPQQEGLESSFYYKGTKIPCVTGSTDQEIVMACLEMLSIYFNVPFRKDVLDRAVAQSLKRSSPSLELVGNMSTYLGFVGSICDLSSTQLHRIPFPCICNTPDGLALIFDISKGSVKAVLPQYGRVTFTVEDLLNGQKGIRILTLSPGRDSQQKSLDSPGLFLR